MLRLVHCPALACGNIWQIEWKLHRKLVRCHTRELTDLKHLVLWHYVRRSRIIEGVEQMLRR